LAQAGLPIKHGFHKVCELCDIDILTPVSSPYIVKALPNPTWRAELSFSFDQIPSDLPV
jgi:hypothetical protein